MSTHFKVYNDQHGHPAMTMHCVGWRIPCESAGGRQPELFRRRKSSRFAAESGSEVVSQLASGCAGPVTLSVPFANWRITWRYRIDRSGVQKQPDSLRCSTTARADSAALYRAKQQGRDRLYPLRSAARLHGCSANQSASCFETNALFRPVYTLMAKLMLFREPGQATRQKFVC
jgi:hypothetical protein